MPKVGMGPIRREQICRAAAAVIARVGFPGTTMRAVAEEAGVSTGMLNHYFANRDDMLLQSLVFVSTHLQSSAAEAIAGEPPGERRVRALLSVALPREAETEVVWRVWIAAYGEAVRSQELRETISGRLEPWYEIIATALEGCDAQPAGTIGLAPRFDGLMNGLVIQALVATPQIAMDAIEDALLAYACGEQG